MEAEPTLGRAGWSQVREIQPLFFRQFLVDNVAVRTAHTAMSGIAIKTKGQSWASKILQNKLAIL